MGAEHNGPAPAPCRCNRGDPFHRRPQCLRAVRHGCRKQSSCAVHSVKTRNRPTDSSTSSRVAQLTWAPPPPWTCTSTKPGAINMSPRSTVVVVVGPLPQPTSLTEPPSMTMNPFSRSSWGWQRALQRARSASRRCDLRQPWRSVRVAPKKPSQRQCKLLAAHNSQDRGEDLRGCRRPTHIAPLDRSHYTDTGPARPQLVHGIQHVWAGRAGVCERNNGGLRETIAIGPCRRSAEENPVVSIDVVSAIFRAASPPRRAGGPSPT